MKFFNDNYSDLKSLNPCMPLLLRTTDNAMPAVTTELEYTTNDLLRYMIQTDKFVDENGTKSEARIEAAKAYLRTDWALLRYERWASPGFDPLAPRVDQTHPGWRDDPKISSDLALFLRLKDAADEQMSVIRSGPNDEFEKAENSLLMTQRIDLWCAGTNEVESAVKHLLKLGKRFNDLEPDNPELITEFFPGTADM